MNENSYSRLLRQLITAACVVIIAMGIRTASHLITVVLIALLLAYCVAPFPRWLIRRFAVTKGWAVALTLALWIVIQVALSLELGETVIHMRLKLPVYEEHLRIVVGHVEAFVRARGYDLASVSSSAQATPARIVEFVESILPGVIGLVSDRILVGLLSLLFLIEMAEHDESKMRSIGRALAHYGGNVQGFLVVMAKTGAITALANFVLLLLVGVDFPGLWCVLYFFLHFIPDVGILISVIPPTLIALLMLGWKSALLVLGGILFFNAFADYVLKPKLMRKAVDVTLLEVTLSLMVWGFLLGAWGGLLAIPLTLSVRKFLAEFSAMQEDASVPAG